MAHILDTELPEERPTGAPGGDFQNIRSSPEMFGGLTADALQTGGRGVEKAATTGIEIATDYQRRQDALHNVEVKNWYADQTTDLHSKFMNLEGRAASDALPEYKQKISDLRQEAVGRAQSPRAQAQLAESLVSIQDQYYRYWAGHAGQQMNVYDKKVTGDAVASSASLAVNSLMAGDEVGFQRHLNSQDNEVRNYYEAQHFPPEAIDQEVQKRRGTTLKTVIETMADSGDLRRANALFDQNKGRMDADSIRQVTAKLKVQNTKLDAIGIVDSETARRSPPQIGADKVSAAIIQQESGGNPNARTSVTGAMGPGQIQPETFKQYARPGERIDVTADNLAVSKRIVDDLYRRYDGDSARVAVAYFSGPGNVSPPGSPTPWISDRSDPTGKTVSSYVNDMQRRLGLDVIAQTKGDVLQRVMDRPDLRENPILRDAVMTEVNRRYTVQQAQWLDEQHRVKVQNDQRQQVSDTTEHQMFRDLHGDAPTLSAQQILDDPRLTHQARDRMFKLYEQVSGESSDRQAAKTYGNGFYEAYQKVHAAPGDPDRITDPGQLYPRLGKDLTVSGIDKLVTEIQGRKASPESEAEGAMKKQFFVNAKGQISGSNEGLHLKDPKGDELYLKFMAQALTAYDEGRKSGKSPAALLNPDSPDYVGKGIATFKRPMDQWFGDMIHDKPGETAAAAKFDISTVKTLADAVDAYKSGKISKAEADQLAISRGWASRKPAAPQLPQVPRL